MGVITIDLLDLYAGLTFDTSAYEHGIAKAEQQAKDADTSISASMKDAGKNAGTAAGTIGTSMAGGVKTVASGAASAVKTVASTVKTIASTATRATESMVRGAVSATSQVVSAFANVGKVAAGVTAAGLGVASAATVKLGKDAFDAYGEYEQLAGGINTLFGEGGTASKALMTYADNAFATVQMSANQYMQTVTDFSASLLQSLDEDAAADKADQALRQIADNSNKMGTAMSSVTDAYKGFAKDNFTMLDNLKLGFGGTAGEMARLVNESGVMNGEIEATAENVKDIPFDKIIDAIGVIQERLGMAGVSQEEALHTLQGSINMTKAAWENLLTGFANPDADLDKLITDLMTSVDAVQENALPAVERILNSMGDAVTKSAPNIAARVGELITKTAPSLMRAASSLMANVGGVVLDTLPDLIDSGVSSIADLVDNSDGGELVTSVINAAQRVAGTVQQYMPRIIGRILGGIKANAPQVRNGIVNVVSTLLDTLDSIIQNEDVTDIVGTMTNTVIDIIGLLAQHAPTFIRAMANMWKEIITVGLSRIKEDPKGFVNTLADIVGAIFGGIADIATTVAPMVGDAITSLFSTGFDDVDKTELGSKLGGLFGGLFDGVDGFTPESVANLCTNIVTTIANGLSPAIETGIPAISSFVADFAAQITSEDNKTKFGDAASNIFGSLCDGISAAANNGDVSSFRTSVVSAIDGVISWITDKEQLAKMTDAGTKLMGGLSDGIDKDVENLITTIENAIWSVVDFIGSDYNFEIIMSSILELLANISVGLYNGLVDIVFDVGGRLAKVISDTLNLGFSDDDFKKQAQQFKDFWHIEGLKKGDVFNGSVDARQQAGLISDEEAFLMKSRYAMGSSYNEETAKRAYSRLKDADRNESFDLTAKVELDVDGDMLAKVNQKFGDNIWARNGNN